MWIEILKEDEGGDLSHLIFLISSFSLVIVSLIFHKLITDIRSSISAGFTLFYLPFLTSYITLRSLTGTVVMREGRIGKLRVRKRNQRREKVMDGAE